MGPDQSSIELRTIYFEWVTKDESQERKKKLGTQEKKASNEKNLFYYQSYNAVYLWRFSR
jgi:hypothetical protein